MKLIEILFVVSCLAITIRAQRGLHSHIHYVLAGIAVVLEIEMILAAMMEQAQSYLTLTVSLFLCIVLVFITDGKDGRAWYRRAWDWIAE